MELALVAVHVEVEARAERQQRGREHGVGAAEIAHERVQGQGHGVREPGVCGEGGEAQAGADAAGLVEEAVVEFCAGGEPAMGLPWRELGGRGCADGIGGGEGFWAEVVEASHAEEGTVGAVEVFGTVFRGIVLQQRKNGAAVWQARVANTRHLQLATWAQPPQIKRFERAPW